jgi:hypothetical protein
MYLHCCRYCGDAVCDCLSGYHACQGCRFCPAGEDDDEDARAEHDCGEDICVCLDPSPSRRGTMNYTHESGCGRCVFFVVEHCGGLFGWLKVIAAFAWHRWSGECKHMAKRLEPHP